MTLEIRVGVTVVVVSFLAAYLLTAFAVWDLNPANWTQSARTAASVIGGLVGYVAAGTAYAMAADMKSIEGMRKAQFDQIERMRR